MTLLSIESPWQQVTHVTAPTRPAPRLGLTRNLETPMHIKDIMTPDPACCTPDTTAREAAGLMRERDCGAIPVVDTREGRRPIGMVTDRDLAIRGLADGRGPD